MRHVRLQNCTSHTAYMRRARCLQQEQLRIVLPPFMVVTSVLGRAGTIHWVSAVTHMASKNVIPVFTNTFTEQVYQPTFSQYHPVTLEFHSQTNTTSYKSTCFLLRGQVLTRQPRKLKFPNSFCFKMPYVARQMPQAIPLSTASSQGGKLYPL